LRWKSLIRPRLASSDRGDFAVPSDRIIPSARTVLVRKSLRWRCARRDSSDRRERTGHSGALDLMRRGGAPTSGAPTIEDMPAPSSDGPRVLAKSGDERLIEWRNTVLRDDAGQVICTFGLAPTSPWAPASSEGITRRPAAIPRHPTNLFRWLRNPHRIV
jgi:hypothetical protein